MTARLIPLVGALLLSGCVSVEMGRLARDVEHQIAATSDAELERGFAISIGGGMIGTSRFLGRLVAPASTEPYRRLSGEVRQVKVARYPLSGSIDGRTLARPARLDAYEADGWLPMVSVRDEDGAVWVMTREDGGTLTDLLAVVVAEDEVVLTRIRGDLTTLVLEAIREAELSDELDEAFREARIVPEPAEPTPVEAAP